MSSFNNDGSILNNNNNSPPLNHQNSNNSGNSPVSYTIQSPAFISPSSTVPSSPSNDGIPTSTCSTPGGKERPKSKEYLGDMNKSSGKDVRNRSQSEADKIDEKHKKKPFLSPKMLLPGKKSSTVYEEPPISKTLDSRMKSNPYIKKFKLPSSELQILLHGRLYLFSNYICFESKIFGIKTTEIIQIQNITSIAKKRFPVAIEIVAQSQKFVFASFVSRDKTFHDLMNSWREVTGESHEDVSSHSIDDDIDDDHINSFEESSSSGNGVTTPPNIIEKSSVISDSLLLSIESINNTDQQNGDFKYTLDNNSNNNNSSSSSSNSNSDQNNININKDNSNNLNEKQQNIINNDGNKMENGHINNNNNNSNNNNIVNNSNNSNSNNINNVKENNHIEKSPFDELYGNYEQFLSTNEQSSILESSISEFQELLSENFNVSVVNFFRALCSDQCNFAFTYHAKRGDSNIVVKNWAHRERFGTVRELEYVAPVNSPIGPDKTRIQETQRYHLTNKKLSIETDTIMLDIPYGDHFRIEAKWDVVETSAETCRLSIQICVRFIKKTWFKSKIESGTIKESKGSFSQWVQLAKQEIQKMLQLKKPTVATVSGASTSAAAAPAAGSASSSSSNTPQQPQLVLSQQLNKSVEKKLLNEEGISSDSPKPHHSRSRSRQHLVSSSGQVTTTPNLNQSITERLAAESSSNLTPLKQQSTPTYLTTPTISPFNNNNNDHINNNNHSTTTFNNNQSVDSNSQFQLKFNSKYGGVTLSGIALFSIILLFPIHFRKPWLCPTSLYL
ncbi:GRAM domain-containing protein [Heterostelium album PN500]|uniref:GRAM domain-containing protein n=1 Tax=Heterostelium pallidum (strain ATCC 26659 / Pp 5 / PN500) TaxID=670386 RepID=D3BEQ1_HETP5|nr:GRAM domain-containing protein [Heterostelium album PN500]EFA80382.1 GRAM domain-containing protein [Heterostelium album PN500]|eukprot:XP_020432502.1 GRAM domain-containing protein [Heterostelium album PN500]